MNTSINNFWRSCIASRKNSPPARTREHSSPPARRPYFFMHSFTRSGPPVGERYPYLARPEQKWKMFPPPARRRVAPRAPRVKTHAHPSLLSTVIFYENNHWWELRRIFSFVEKDFVYDKNSFFFGRRIYLNTIRSHKRSPDFIENYYFHKICLTGWKYECNSNGGQPVSPVTGTTVLSVCHPP
jgi:hypothetical protein